MKTKKTRKNKYKILTFRKIRHKMPKNFFFTKDKQMADYIDAEMLKNELENVKNMRKDPYNGYFLEALYEKAHILIDQYSQGECKISSENAELFEKYIYEMTRNKYGRIDSCGYRGMQRLKAEHGIKHRYKGPKEKKSKSFASINKLVAKLNTIPHLLDKHPKTKKIVNKIKNWTIGGAIVIAGFFGGRELLNENNNYQQNYSSYTTTTSNKSLYTETPVVSKDSTKKQVNNVKEVVIQKQTENTAKENLNKNDSIWKNYYDSALKIHLGTQKRDSLYQQISNMIKTKKLVPNGQFSVYRYAHSVTMWNLLKPNSQENKFLQNALQGKTLSPEENRRFNFLVNLAGEKGKGIIASGKHSNYDRSSKSTKAHHLKAIQTVNQYLKTHSR